MTRFGKWIFISTLFGFLINNADRLILGKFMSMEALGIYSIAYMMANIFKQIYEQVSSKILFPLYGKIKHLPREVLAFRIRKIRIGIMSGFLPFLCLIVVFGQEIIALLFDARYQNAGWMLQVLTSGFIPITIIGIGPFYLSLGHSFVLMVLVATRAILFIVFMIVGGILNGSSGLIWGIASHNILVYLLDVLVQIRYSIWQPKLDLYGYMFATMAILFGFWAKSLFST